MIYSCYVCVRPTNRTQNKFDADIIIDRGRGDHSVLLGTFVIGGIVYTYSHRPTALIDTVSHLFDGRKLPVDL